MTDLDWSDGVPRSRRYDDIYFSPEDGLAESRAVFLDGCGLPEAWAGRERFVVGELGFGTGLNILALLAVWRATRPSATARLDVMSIEAHPIAPADAARALAAWPELAGLAHPLLARWPRGRRGPHRFDWPELGATLDLRVDEVGPALAGWSGRADAWFLDGFAPSRNPAMWTPEVLAAVAEHSGPGARAATFTVAGGVRRGLEAAGFTLARRPGHGAKRERLEARLPGPPLGSGRRVARVAIVGGGVAGAALVRALTREGLSPILVEAARVGAGASGNAAALVTPRLDAGFGGPARLHAHAFARAVEVIEAEAEDAVIARGVLQLARRPGDADRFARFAAWDGFDPGALLTLAPLVAAARLGETVAPDALDLCGALVVHPAILLARWIGDTPRIAGRVAALEPAAGGWRLLDDGGVELACVDAVCLAVGADLRDLLSKAPLRVTRGQVETASAAFAGAPTAWGGYAVPTLDGGHLYGATHVRGDAGVEARQVEREANFETLAAVLPARADRLRAVSTSSRASLRLATPDHLPIADATDRAGVYVLGALGGRGFTLAPLLAEHLAATIAGAPASLTVEAQGLVERRPLQV